MFTLDPECWFKCEAILHARVVFISADLGACPKGWEERPGSSDCYIVTDSKDMRTFDEASAECQKQQGQLVKVDSIAERVRFNSYV